MQLMRSVLAAKLEATVGTDAAPDATNATFNAYNVVMDATPVMEEREGQTSFDMLPQVNGARSAKCTFSTHVQWDGTATEPAWAEIFLPACGWVKSGQTYNPSSKPTGTSSSDPRTVTLWHYVDGKLKKMYGAVGKFTVDAPSGKLAVFNWEFDGLWGGETDAALIDPTFVTDTCYKATAGCTWNSVALRPSRVTIDSGNRVKIREDFTPTGFHSGVITGRYPKVTIDAEGELVATQDRQGDWLAGTERALSIGLGGVGNSVVTFASTKSQIIKIGFGDRERLVVDNLELACNKNGTNIDQSLSITFTAAT